MTKTANDKPKVGVSQCLLGDAVRYDGKSKPDDIVINELSQCFNLIPICPEVEAGFGIPRPAIQLTESSQKPNVLGRDDPSLDVSLQLHDYCRDKMAHLTELSGFIFKSGSPSCGLNSTPVYIDQIPIDLYSRGIFARAVVQTYPQLPVIEEIDFMPRENLDHFIAQVQQHHALQLS